MPNNTPNHKQTIGFLILPFIVFAGLIAFSTLATMGTHFKLPVQGYDPRDLLMGHYMNLRINQSVIDRLKECACIDATSTITYDSCAAIAKQSCVATLNSNSQKLLKSLVNPIQIYVDEMTAPAIEDAIRKDPKRVMVDATLDDGAIVVHGLILDGQPVKMMQSNPFDKPVK